MIQVCHLAKYYPPATGGIETHVQTLARRQQALGAQVTVLCIDHRHVVGTVSNRPSPTHQSDEEWDQGVRIVRVPRRFAVLKWDYSPGLYRTIRSIADRSADLFHLHYPNPTMALALLRANCPTPLVITHHSDVVRQVFAGRALLWLDRKLMRKATAVFATSPCYAPGSRLLSEFREKVEELPLGIDLRQFLEPSAEACRIRDQYRERYLEPLWLSVGRLVYYKGLETAIHALRGLPGRLLLIGEGSLRAQLEAVAVRVGVADRLIWRGRVDADELVGAYHAATALLFPSNARSEAFGLVQIEAMASGCPVINTAIPHSGVPWVCPHEVAGVTVPVDDPCSLAAAARRLLDDPDYRRRLAAAGKKRAIEMFSAEVMARRSLSAYARVLRSAGGTEITASSTHRDPPMSQCDEHHPVIPCGKN